MQFLLDPLVLLAALQLVSAAVIWRAEGHRKLAMLQLFGGILLLVVAGWTQLYPTSTAVWWALVGLAALGVAAGAWFGYSAWRGIRAMREADRSAPTRMMSALNSPGDRE